MNWSLLYLICILPCSSSWTTFSWRDKKPTKFIQKYKDEEKLKQVENTLKKYGPLVSGSECDDLKRKLREVSIGKKFLLMGGDCAESLESSTNYNRDLFRLLLHMGIFLSYSNGLPTVKIPRIAGQFAKPRSNDFEILQNGTKIESYKGDIINDISKENREPDPERMILVYKKSVQILNLLRSFSFGGYANIHNMYNWKLDPDISSLNEDYEKKIKNSLRFMKGLNLNINEPIFSQTKIFTGHESLLLNYEESLTRKDSFLKKYYACSAHFLWVGERTRDIHSPHIEFLKGVSNPIGIKISEKIQNQELVNLIRTLNPENECGKITLITRFGVDTIRDHLPRLIKTIRRNHLSVVWCCDPMHGNTKTIENNIKTRFYDDILKELTYFFEIHRRMGTFGGGIHLEMSPEMVTECIDNEIVHKENITERYMSKCDPRLNRLQSMNLICELCDYFIQKDKN